MKYLNIRWISRYFCAIKDIYSVHKPIFISFGQQLANHITVKRLINCQKTACLFIMFAIFQFFKIFT